MEQPKVAPMPLPPFANAEQLETAVLVPALIPELPLPCAEQAVMVPLRLTAIPTSPLALASTRSTRQLTCERALISTPLPPQLRTEPLTTAMFRRELTTVFTPASEPATPTRSKPLRSSVTPLAAMPIPFLPLTPVMLPVR